MGGQSGHASRTPRCPLSGGLCCESRLAFGLSRRFEFWSGICALHWEHLTVYLLLRPHYASQGTAAVGGGWQRSLTRRRRFCAVAVSSTSSLTPLKPRSRSRSSLRMRFMCANRSPPFCAPGVIVRKPRCWPVRGRHLGRPHEHRGESSAKACWDYTAV